MSSTVTLAFCTTWCPYSWLKCSCLSPTALPHTFSTLFRTFLLFTLSHKTNTGIKMLKLIQYAVYTQEQSTNFHSISQQQILISDISLEQKMKQKQNKQTKSLTLYIEVHIQEQSTNFYSISQQQILISDTSLEQKTNKIINSLQTNIQLKYYHRNIHLSYVTVSNLSMLFCK